MVFLLAVHLASASPGEVTLVAETLKARFLPDYPDPLSGDKTYDSDPLDEMLMTTYGIKMIARHRGQPPTPAHPPRMGHSADGSGAGRSNRSSRGSITRGAW